MINEIPKSLKEWFERAHRQDDKDASWHAGHHSLGFRNNQASPGSHTHDGVTSKLISAVQAAGFYGVTTTPSISVTAVGKYLIEYDCNYNLSIASQIVSTTLFLNAAQTVSHSYVWTEFNATTNKQIMRASWIYDKTVDDLTVFNTNMSAPSGTRTFSAQTLKVTKIAS